MKDEKVIREFPVYEGKPAKIFVFIADSQFVAISYGELITIWNLETVKLISRLEGHDKDVTQLVYDNDNKQLVSTCTNGMLRYWRSNLWEENFNHPESLKDHIDILSMSPNYEWLVTTYKGKVALWKLKTHAVVAEFLVDKWFVTAMVFSPDSQYLAITGRFNSNVKLYRVEDLLADSNSPTYREFIADYHMEGCKAKNIFNISEESYSSSGAFQTSFTGMTADSIPTSIGIALDGRELVAYCQNHIKKHYGNQNFSSGYLIRTLAVDNDRLIVANSDGSIHIWSWHDSENRLSLCSSPAGTNIDYQPLETATRVFQKARGVNWVRNAMILFMPNEQDFLHIESFKNYNYNNSSVVLFNGSRKGRKLYEGNEIIHAAVFCSSEKHLLAIAENNFIKILDLNSKEIIDFLDGHTANIVSLAITPDYKYLVSSSEDMTVRIWEIETHQCLYRIEGLNTVTSQVECGQDASGLFFITRSADNCIRSWRVLEPVEDTDKVKVILEWTNAQTRLIAYGADFENTKHLSYKSLHVLQQHGALVSYENVNVKNPFSSSLIQHSIFRETIRSSKTTLLHSSKTIQVRNQEEQYEELLTLAQAEKQAENYENALKYAAEAYGLYPDVADICYFLADTYWLSSIKEKNVEHDPMPFFEKAVKIEKTAMGLLNYACFLERQMIYKEEVLKYLDELLVTFLNEISGPVLLDEATFLKLPTELQEKLGVMDSITLDYRTLAAYLGMYVCFIPVDFEREKIYFQKLGEYVESIEDVDALTAAYYLLGDSRQLFGEYTKAFEYFRKALDLNPGFTPAENSLQEIADKKLYGSDDELEIAQALILSTKTSLYRG